MKTLLFYRSLCRQLSKVLNDCPKPISANPSETSFVPDDYTIASLADRRDLQQKLIDAGREKEYAMANDSQNRFARQYHKQGLYTEAKARNDKLLAQVEQRFKTHVYTAKICKGAPDNEIADAIQNSVINPLMNGLSGATELDIYQALWFLTEQCYIQWDAP